MRRALFDIEADGLLDTITRVWSLVIWNFEELLSFPYWELDKGVEELLQYDQLIGHNIAGYDIPALGLIYPNLDFSPIEIVDTLTTSRYLWPERPWGHSLEDWGTRVGVPKTDFHDWSKWSPTMQRYCEQDVRVNYAILKRLEKEYGGEIPGFKIYSGWTRM